MKYCGSIFQNFHNCGNSGHSSYKMEESKRSYSLEELETRRKMSESELKRQLSHDLANDPTFATVFNPPQIFSDEDNKTIVWTNNEPIVSQNFWTSFKTSIFDV